MAKKYCKADLFVKSGCVFNTDKKKVIVDTYAAGVRFDPGETYTIEYEQGFVKETASNQFLSPLDSNAGSFTTNSTGPQVQSETPSGTNVINNTSITYTYDRQLLAGNGNYYLYRETGSPDEEVAVFNPSDSTANTTISGNQITLNTTGLLRAGETYYVLIDEGAVEDKDGLAAFGFDNDQEHNFTTATTDFPDLSATLTGAFSPVATLNYAPAKFVSQMANSFQMSVDATAINPVSANLTALFTQTSNIERTRGIVPLTLTNNITITSKSTVFYDSFNQTFTATAGVNCKTGFTISLESTYTSDLGIASTHRYWDTAVVDADSNTEILALGIQGFGDNTEVHIKENNSTTISGAVSNNQYNDDFGWAIDMAIQSNTNRDDVRLVIGSKRWDYTDSGNTTYQSMGRVIVKELARQGTQPYAWNNVGDIQRTAQGDFADDIQFGKEVAISNDSEWVAVVQQSPSGQSSPESQLHFYKRNSSGFYSDGTRYTISSTSSPLNVSNGFNNARPSFNKGTGSMCVVNFDGDCLVIDADFTNSTVSIDQTISLSSGGDIECAAISGDKRFIAMGQPNHNSQRGQVTIYKLNSSGTYVSHSVITPSGFNQYTYFGKDIQMSEQGDVMFVSAPGDDFSGSEQGKVYVYVRNSTSSNGWDLKQTLTQSQSNDEFGRRISLSGNFKYFSAVQPYYDQYDGKAYFYHIDDA